MCHVGCSIQRTNVSRHPFYSSILAVVDLSGTAWTGRCEAIYAWYFQRHHRKALGVQNNLQPYQHIQILAQLIRKGRSCWSSWHIPMQNLAMLSSSHRINVPACLCVCVCLCRCMYEGVCECVNGDAGKYQHFKWSFLPISTQAANQCTGSHPLGLRNQRKWTSMASWSDRPSFKSSFAAGKKKITSIISILSLFRFK